MKTYLKKVDIILVLHDSILMINWILMNSIKKGQQHSAKHIRTQRDAISQGDSISHIMILYI